MILAMMPRWIGTTIAIFGVKYSKFRWKNREKWENICSIHICWYIGTKFCTVVVHILDRVYWTYFETQKGPNYWYEQSFFVWCLLRLRNGGLNSGQKLANIITDASIHLSSVFYIDATWIHIFATVICTIIQIETSTKMYTPFLIGIN